ncbi:hypothetical protein [Clostridium amazonitimonense]|uniref:hypothetical protein n=1 Tax=Clostridium amazonitimonense TaxID=1499689 RepID=UPI0005099434|nr:hypothetical protein [Clostridium amazonitimonense]
MDIKKAVKRQKKYFKIFMISMIFMFLILPLALFLYGNINWFLLSYMISVEIMIVFAIIYRCNWEALSFQCYNNKLKLKSGIIDQETMVFCDKISIIHTLKDKEDMEIIIVSSTKIRSKRSKPINKDFYKKYPVASMKYEKQKKLNPERDYYYLVIKKGGFYKYELLDVIYKNCVKAVYTEEAIENIKIARGQKELIF